MQVFCREMSIPSGHLKGGVTEDAAQPIKVST